MENIKPEVNKNGQYDINFENSENSENFDIEKIVEDLNKKYPYAKLNPSIVKYNNGFYIISDQKMDLKGLEIYISNMNDLYKPDDNESWFNK